jgi:hypothetical protein
MGTVNKTFTFSNGTTSDATQVNTDLDTLFTLVNGNIDDTNVKAGTINNGIATEAITPGKSKGLAYAVDLWGTTGFVLPGTCATSKDGTNQNQINVTQGIVWVLQADGTLKRFTPAATNFRTASASATYYLDFNPDGTWSWTTGHSSQVNYVTVAMVTTDTNANVSTVTDNRVPFAANVNALAQQMRIRNYMGV